jgi:hypothetical protein
MSTSYPNSKLLTPEDPDMVQAYDRLVKFFDAQRQTGPKSKVFTTNRLVDVAGEITSVHLALLLSQFVEAGWLEQFLRVETDQGTGLHDFSSLDEVPDEVYDWKETQQMVRVQPSNLRVLYRLHQVV